MPSKDIKQWVLLVLFVIGTGLGAALIMKVAIGVSAWDGLTQSLAELSNIQIGTMGLLINLFCIVIQVFILRKSTKWTILFQIPMSILLGMVVNLIYYDVLKNFTITVYPLQIVFYFLGQIIIAGSVGAIMVLDLAFFPLEGMCLAIAEKTKFQFVKVRQAVDFVCVILALLLFIIFKGTLTIREGTIIGMLIFSPLVGLFMKFWKPILRKNSYQ